MMKSILFFLAVFTVGVVGLLVVSGDLGRWLTSEPTEPKAKASEKALKTASKVSVSNPPTEEGNVDQEESPAPVDPNEIMVPVYDVVKGRLEYTFRGHLNESQLKDLRDIHELNAVSLRDGRLEVPIYEDLAQEIPSQEDKSTRLFILNFAEAEYRAFRRPAFPGSSRKAEREREVVRLKGGGDRGVGTTDDGSKFTFEELVFEIDRKPKTENYFTIRSDKPVTIQNEYLHLESPSGLEGIVSKNKGLQKLSFFPPVRTYLSPRAARLFALGGKKAPPKGQDSRGKESQAPPQTRVVITCEGPLTFLLHEDEPTIRFEKDVLIYPLKEPTPSPGSLPPIPGPTRFHSQLLVIKVDPKAHPPRPTHAVATWEGGRVRAHHFDKLMEGDRLVWTLPASKAEKEIPLEKPKQDILLGDAVLSGKPRLTGEEGWIETGEIIFKLDEDRILLREGLTGVFRGNSLKSPTSRSEQKRKKESKPALIEKLPQEWGFHAGEGELVFAPADSKEEKPRSGEDPLSVKKLVRLIARASSKDPLEVQSDEGGRYRLLGNTLEYDALANTVTVESGQESKPRFWHDRDTGTAQLIQLRLDEGLVAMRGGVRIKIEDIKTYISDKKSNGTKPQEEPPSEKMKPSGDLPDVAQGPVEILAEELDLRFDSKEQLLGIEARGELKSDSFPERPVIFQEFSPQPQFRLAGYQLSWDHIREVALLLGTGGPPSPETGGSVPKNSLIPELKYEGGTLIADSIWFDRKAWKVILEGRVKITSRPSPTSSKGNPVISNFSDDSRKDPGKSRVPNAEQFELRAGRAELDLTENFEPIETPASKLSRGLERIEKIHAWAPGSGAIELEGESFQGRSQEATWNAGSQELHIFGPGRQEIVWIDGEQETRLSAKDIVYSCIKSTVVLTGDVQTEVRVEDTLGLKKHSTSGPMPATWKPDPKSDPPEILTFNCRTNRVEATVRETAKGLEPVEVRALEKVLLWNDRYGIQLRGDEFIYDHKKRNLLIFSREGRFQTLTRTHKEERAGAKSKDEDPKEVKVDQIDAREIQLTYKLSPSNPGKDSSLFVEQVLIKFKDDVTAKFFPSLKSEMLENLRSEESLEEWKMQSDHLGVKLIPDGDRSRILQLALAEGNVIFTSGDNMATAQEAFYQEADSSGESQKSLTLWGDSRKPARLFISAKNPTPPITGTEIMIYRLGESKLGWRKKEKPGPGPLGLQELRR